MTTTPSLECPVCHKTFTTRKGRGGHLATKQDQAHLNHRLQTDPALQHLQRPATPEPAPARPAPETPPRTPESVPTPTRPASRPKSSTAMATAPAPAPEAAPGGVDMQALLSQYAHIWSAANDEEATQRLPPEIQEAHPYVRAIYIFVGILVGGISLYFLVQSKRGAKAAQARSQTVKPAAPTMNESEEYWRNIAGASAIRNPRRPGPGSGGWM